MRSALKLSCRRSAFIGPLAEMVSRVLGFAAQRPFAQEV
jgi:hypothetical protein